MNSTREYSFLSRLAACLSLALLLLVPSLAKAWNNDVMVNTAYGAVKGSLSNDGTTMIWQGVPYAKPPVDDFVNQIYLRWKAPQDQAPWQGVREATRPALKCTQLQTTDDWLRTGIIDPDSGEDCLYVTIYRPNNSKKLPVYVWIHGGSNNFGSAREYGATELAVRSDVVVVVVQYRLGPIGWFYHPALQSGTDPLSDSGNFGTLDTAKALKWIQQNIAAFGGDTNKVTVTGESAGAHNTMNLVISPVGKGLFNGAMYESGGMAPVTADSGRASANDYIEKLLMFADGVSTPVSSATRAAYAQKRVAMENAGTLASYLRHAKAGDLFLAILKYGSVPTFPIIEDGNVMPLGGWIPAIQSGNYNKMPIILGSNEYELKPFEVLFGSIVALYGAPSTLPTHSWFDLFTSVRNNRGGLGNQDTAISGNSATTRRARRPGKQKDHEQETAPQPLVDLQGQGGLGRHSRREDVGRVGQAARRAPQPDQRLEEPVARARGQRVRRRIGGGAAGGLEGAARQDRSARAGE